MIIQNKKIGPGEKTFFIADIAANHDGDLKRALDKIQIITNDFIDKLVQLQTSKEKEIKI